MDNRELRDLLEELHGKIEHANTIDAKGQELLRDVSAHIHDLLERSEGDQVEPHPSTIRQLEDTIDYLEITHPAFTMILSKMMAILCNAGI